MELMYTSEGFLTEESAATVLEEFDKDFPLGTACSLEEECEACQ
jgi:hypothetical protein